MTTEMQPIGRRVAHWRSRRKMSQQVFADRLGKSKSWVDKVERGVRSLDRMSTLRDIATVLRIDAAVLIGRGATPVGRTERAEGVNRVAAALSTYDIAVRRTTGRPLVPADRMTRIVEHAWTTFQHARYSQVTALAPQLLVDAQRTYADDPDAGRSQLVEAYRVTASLLTKLGASELAWLTADRAMHCATDEPRLTAMAAIQVSQALRACGRSRAAMSTALHAAYRIAAPDSDDGGAEELSLCGALIMQSALAAARHGDHRGAARLLDEAEALAARVGDGHDHHRTDFGPTAVMLARARAALDLGDGRDAVGWHEKAVRRDGWRWLAAEHRAGHLVRAARANLRFDRPAHAARALIDAFHIAPEELRHRAAARAVLTQVARDPYAPATIIQLAATLSVA
ncbi:MULTISPECIES: helix-turn-helix domain-containing protein [unclassified Micromonospora]|uniref:helix-turn-helix domain-containing protein n=1 Tax=unclassified Micromonospora TaxID=2617518 RepID=UPI00259CC11F|nr:MULTISPECIES: helix-turn-helix domain-containing protein [unclassified Micromonospora]MDM4782852.1 helix-turn-helix domain-containing protein [Micromonospora sp. b486]